MELSLPCFAFQRAANLCCEVTGVAISAGTPRRDPVASWEISASLSPRALPAGQRDMKRSHSYRGLRGTQEERGENLICQLWVEMTDEKYMSGRKRRILYPHGTSRNLAGCIFQLAAWHEYESHKLKFHCMARAWIKFTATWHQYEGDRMNLCSRTAVV